MAPITLVKRGEVVGQLAAVKAAAPVASSESSTLPVDPLLVRRLPRPRAQFRAPQRRHPGARIAGRA